MKNKKAKIIIVTALLLTPVVSFGAMFCTRWVEVPDRPCPTDGNYESHEEFYKCGLEREEEKLDRWNEVAAQIQELEKELPLCALVFTDNAPCKTVSKFITTKSDF